MDFISAALFATAAKATYKLVLNRKEIAQQVEETGLEVARFSHLQKQFKTQLQTLQEEAQKIAPLAQDLTYKSQVLGQEAQARVAEIQKNWQDREQTPK